LLKSICIEKGLPHVTTSGLQKEAVTALSPDQMLGIGLVLGADRSRYGTMVRSFENAYTAGRDEWPKTLVAAYRVLTNWKQERNNSIRLDSEGVSFATEDNGRGNKKNMNCFNCGKKGHLAYECTEEAKDNGKNEANTSLQAGDDGTAEEETGEQLLIDAVERGKFDHEEEHFSFHVMGTFRELTIHTLQEIVPNKGNETVMESDIVLNLDNKVIPLGWILPDDQSTVDVFANATLLTNIRAVKGSLKIHTQAGTVRTNLNGDLSGYGNVWHCCWRDLFIC